MTCQVFINDDFGLAAAILPPLQIDLTLRSSFDPPNKNIMRKIKKKPQTLS